MDRADKGGFLPELVGINHPSLDGLMVQGLSWDDPVPGEACASRKTQSLTELQCPCTLELHMACSWLNQRQMAAPGGDCFMIVRTYLSFMGVSGLFQRVVVNGSNKLHTYVATSTKRISKLGYKLLTF